MKKKKNHKKADSQIFTSQIRSLRLHIPMHFIILSRLLKVPEEKIIQDFMNTVSMESYGLGEEQRNLLSKYFILCSYGQEYFTKEEILKILNQLNSIGTLWPEEASINVIEAHAKWREQYFRYWVEGWEGRGGRVVKPSL